MSGNERAIYWLLAQGRLTVAEAERLLAASRKPEVAWLVVTVLLTAILVGHDPSNWMAGAAEAMLRSIPGCAEIAHRVQTAIMGI